MSKSYDLSTSTKWANLADGEHVVKLKSKGTGYGSSSFSNSVTVTKGAAVSKNWKFNGTAAAFPQKSMQTYDVISGKVYKDSTEVEAFTRIYYNSDWTYIAFGQGGFWDTSDNTWGKYGGNILKFDTEPDGALLSFLQAHATPIDGGVTEHTLTFSDVTVTVDGVSVTSPYTLTKDCTIVADVYSVDKPTPNTGSPQIMVNDYPATSDETLSISNKDITLTGYKGDTGIRVTINYTA